VNVTFDDVSQPGSDEEPSHHGVPLPTHPPAMRWRLLALLVMVGVGWLLADHFGLTELTSEELRTMVLGAGVLGFAVYTGVFATGQLLHLPGILFIVGARIIYGPFLGFGAAYVAGLFSVCVSFWIVRGVGGQQLQRVRWSPMKRALARVDRSPIRAIAIMRTFVSVSPPLNYALAMSNVRFRDYFLGSAAGLVIPVAFVVFLSEAVFRALGWSM